MITSISVVPRTSGSMLRGAKNCTGRPTSVALTLHNGPGGSQHRSDDLRGRTLTLLGTDYHARYDVNHRKHGGDFRVGGKT